MRRWQPKQVAKATLLRTSPSARRLVGERNELRARLERTEKELTTLRADHQHLIDTSHAGSDERGLGFLFVVTYGRSGSTLLQGILNSIPGYLIRGENGQAAYHLYKFHQEVLSSQGKFKTRNLTPAHPWYGLDQYPEEDAIAHLRSTLLGTLLRPEPDTRVTGFKEIRWWQDDWQAYFEFLDQVFPGMRVILNTRNWDDVAKSKWWSENPDPQQVLARHEERLGLIEEKLGARAFRVHYDDWTQQPETLESLFSWLGEPFDRAMVERVMARRHSY